MCSYPFEILILFLSVTYPEVQLLDGSSIFSLGGNLRTIFHSVCTKCPFSKSVLYIPTETGQIHPAQKSGGFISFSVTRPNPGVGKGFSFPEVHGVNSLPSSFMLLPKFSDKKCNYKTEVSPHPCLFAVVLVCC